MVENFTDFLHCSSDFTVDLQNILWTTLAIDHFQHVFLCRKTEQHGLFKIALLTISNS